MRTLSLCGVKAWVLLAAILLAGTALRIDHWVAERAFWADELAVIENLAERDFRQLGEPLGNGQMAPYGFLALTKIAGTLSAYDELGTRLPAAAAGLLALALFARLAVRILAPQVALLATFLFATCSWLIYYAAEAKQYGFDVLASVALLLLGLHVRDHPRPGARALFALVAAVLVWLSHPSAFVIAALGGVLAADRLHARQPRQAALALAMCAPALASFMLHLWLTSALTSQNAADMRELYWARNFMPLPPASLADIAWYPDSLLRVLSAPAGFRLEGLAAALAVIGAWRLGQRDRLLAAALVLPLIIALVASAARLYPFTGRFLLFAVPALLILLAEGLAFTVSRLWGRSRVLAVVLVGVLLFHPVGWTLKQAAAPSPYAREQLPEVLDHLRHRYAPGQHVYVYADATAGFDFYAPRHGVADLPRLDAVSAGGVSGFVADLPTLRCAGEVWVVIAHTLAADERHLLALLDHAGRRVSGFRGPESPLFESRSSAAVYLYDFADAPVGAHPQGAASGACGTTDDTAIAQMNHREFHDPE